MDETKTNDLHNLFFLKKERSSPSWRRNWNSDILTLDPHGIHWSLLAYASHPNLPLSHSIISPIYTDLSNFPPILIQAGEAEVLVDDAIGLHERAGKVGCVSELQVFADMFHVFQGKIESTITSS
jgi:acetyl esterase/lipase